MNGNYRLWVGLIAGTVLGITGMMVKDRHGVDRDAHEQETNVAGTPEVLGQQTSITSNAQAPSDEALRRCQSALLSSWMNASNPTDIASPDSAETWSDRFVEAFYDEDDPDAVVAAFDGARATDIAHGLVEGSDLELNHLRIDCDELPCIMDIGLEPRDLDAMEDGWTSDRTALSKQIAETTVAELAADYNALDLQYDGTVYVITKRESEDFEKLGDGFEVLVNQITGLGRLGREDEGFQWAEEEGE